MDKVTIEKQSPLRRSLGLRAGEWVVVRSEDEILATLNERGRMDGLPFQPEMFAHCGQRLRVFKVAHKTCDTINKTGGRRMQNAVHLEGARCDGRLHGGCQADCVFFWKEAWLRRADEPGPTAASGERVAAVCTEATVQRATRAPGDEDSSDPAWVCQNTALFEASEPLKWWDCRQYVRDVTSGNHSAWHMVKLLMFGSYRSLLGLGVGYRILLKLYNMFQKLRGGRPYPLVQGMIPKGQSTPHEESNLKPGEWVQVKSLDEILQTLNSQGFNRGMWFDQEMARYCGGKYRVQMRVNRLISERTGKMLEMKNPCIQLEDVYCRAHCTAQRLGCPRATNTYWREIWLRRIPSS